MTEYHLDKSWDWWFIHTQTSMLKNVYDKYLSLVFCHFYEELNDAFEV